MNDLPKTLDETYSRTLLGIDEEKREYAQRLFRCLAVSIRPLRVEELAEILAIQFDEEALPTFNTDRRPANAEEAVMSLCSSLIAIVDRGGHQVVQFSHFSLKEYLTSERLAAAEERLSYYHILPEAAHAILAQAGLSLLLHLNDEIDRDTIAHFPLAPYAARHWVDHAQFRNVSSHIKEVMKHLFDPTKPHFAAWVWLYDIDCYWTERMPTMHPTRPKAVPLYYASLCGFADLAEHLIATHSPDVNSRGGSHATALHAALVKGHLRIASLLLRNGADPNSRDHLGRVPLHKVSQGGQLVMAKSRLEIAQLLINSGADVNVADDEGCVPLHAAAQTGYREIAELLLESSTSLDSRNRKPETPLGLSYSKGKPDMAHFLIDHGSDITRLLLDHDTDADRIDDGGWTPLHVASHEGHDEIVQLLFNHGADANRPDNGSWTPLHLASWEGHEHIVRLLLDYGVNVNHPDNGGWTPLHAASQEGHNHIVELLLDHGADPNHANGEGSTSLHVASQMGHDNAVRLLLHHGAVGHRLDGDGWASLHLASKRGHYDVVGLLLQHGADSNHAHSTNGLTPLHLALQGGHDHIIRLLLEHGADSNHAHSTNGLTPLHLASQEGHDLIVRLLLEHGADANSLNSDGWTPLRLASQRGHDNIVQLLLKHGADADHPNSHSSTPRGFASREGDVERRRIAIATRTRRRL